mgnify:CR=1 FL=1
MELFKATVTPDKKLFRSAGDALVHKTKSLKAYLIIGYNQLSIVVLEPEKGWYKIGINEAETMFEANGNQFITYVPDK